MSKSQSPIICVTCQRPLPEDLKAADAPQYFAQEDSLPRSDDDTTFSNEAATILSFIKAVTRVTRNCSDPDLDHTNVIFDLLIQLSEEAQRRLELADAAAHEIWARDHSEDASTHPRRA